MGRMLLVVLLSTLLTGCLALSAHEAWRLPDKTRYPTVLLRGEDETVVSSAATWLEARGVLVVRWRASRPPSRDDAPEQQQDERAILRQEAARLGCHWVVDVQTVIQPLRLTMPALTMDSMKLEKGTVYHLLVAVTGTDPASGVVVWEGAARSFLTAEQPQAAIPRLAGQALAEGVESFLQRGALRASVPPVHH